MARRIRFSVVLVALQVFAFAVTARATPITSSTAGISFAVVFWGTSFTTPTGGPWDNITFNFFSGTSAITPTASGTLFLLDQEYTGTPAALGSGTTGFLAQSQSISSGVYLFDPALILQPNSQYFAYANASFPVSGGAPGASYAGGQVYFAFNSVTAFQTNPLADVNFLVSGNTIAVPEPASLTLFGTCIAGLLAMRRRQRKS